MLTRVMLNRAKHTAPKKTDDRREVNLLQHPFLSNKEITIVWATVEPNVNSPMIEAYGTAIETNQSNSTRLKAIKRK